jgi:hypothetical protein
VAGSDAITDEKQDEELRKKLLRERRNGVHSEERTYKLHEVLGVNAEQASKILQSIGISANYSQKLRVRTYLAAPTRAVVTRRYAHIELDGLPAPISSIFGSAFITAKKAPQCGAL